MAEPLAPAPPPDPWAQERARAPGAILMRRIDCTRALQFWIRIERSAKNLALGAELWDGSTWITPAPAGSDAEARQAREAIIAEYDARYTPADRAGMPSAELEREERIAIEAAANAAWAAKAQA